MSPTTLAKRELSTLRRADEDFSSLQPPSITPQHQSELHEQGSGWTREARLPSYKLSRLTYRLLRRRMGKSSKSTKRALEGEAAPSSEAPAAEAVAMDVDASTAEPKAKKSKKDKAEDGGEKEIPAEALAVIASPLAVKKTGKHVLKLVKKGE